MFSMVDWRRSAPRGRWFARLALALAVISGSTGCDYFPRDSNDSLETALQRGTLRVGVSHSPPWVSGQAPEVPSGVEAGLISEFADRLGLKVEWYWGDAENHVAALERFELDVLIGGFSQSNRMLERMGKTVPYYTSYIMVALPQSADAVADLDGVRVAMLPASAVSKELQKRDAHVVIVQQPESFDGPIALPAWQADALGLQLSHFELARRHHILAVPPAENALLMRLESFLLETAVAATIHDRLVNEYR
jgi:polar amino acid transport system substrate-binding protein